MARKVPHRVALTDPERIAICTELQLEAARGRARAASFPEGAHAMNGAAEYEDAIASWLLGIGKRPRPPVEYGPEPELKESGAT